MIEEFDASIKERKCMKRRLTKESIRLQSEIVSDFITLYTILSLELILKM